MLFHDENQSWADHRDHQVLGDQVEPAHVNQAGYVHIAKRRRIDAHPDISHSTRVQNVSLNETERGISSKNHVLQPVQGIDEINDTKHLNNVKHIHGSVNSHDVSSSNSCDVGVSHYSNSFRKVPRSPFFDVVLGDYQKDCSMSSLYRSTTQPPADLLTTPMDTTVHSQTLVATEKHEDEYACFGLVVVDLKSKPSSINDDITSEPVRLQALGSTLMFYRRDNDKYLGLVASSAITKLMYHKNIHLDAKLVKRVASEPEKNTSKGSAGKNKRSISQKSTSIYAVEILVSGKTIEMDAVCLLLSNSELFLQHPRIDDMSRFKYNNPHFMVRPGTAMLVHHTIPESIDANNNKESRQLLEVQKNQLMRIFDAAGDNIEIEHHVQPSPRLVAELQPHQKVALAFMLEKESSFVRYPRFPILWEMNETNGMYHHIITRTLTQTPKPANGGILADDMGLGKTLTVLALICCSIDKISLPSVSGSQQFHPSNYATLVVTPKSTIPNWQDQIKRHTKAGSLRIQVYHGSDKQYHDGKFESIDLVITTYETLRSEWIKNGSLINHKWFRVVLDEAHHIRNRSSQVFQAVCSLHSYYRWCSTGTPIHNCLDDYGALLSFIGIEPFADKAKFDHWIANPLQSNTRPNLENLRALVKATCLRRSKNSEHMSCELPSRKEDLITVALSPTDRELYNYFNDKAVSISKGLNSKSPRSKDVSTQTKTNVLTLINNLRLICNHGAYLLPMSARQEFDERSSATGAWQASMKGWTQCYGCGGRMDGVPAVGTNWIDVDPKDMLCSSCATNDGGSDFGDDTSSANTPQPFSQAISVDHAAVSPSAKIEALLENLCAVQDVENGSKCVVFSYWTKMLDSIQSTLEHHGFRAQRIDGSTSLPARAKAMHQFQHDSDCTVMLASIGSAGEGVDFIAANHVHLMEPHWNPMIEAQAVDRVHRIGQTRPVTITRYIVRDSIENYVQWLQQDKIKLVNQSIDLGDVTQQGVDEKRWEKLRAILGGES